MSIYVAVHFLIDQVYNHPNLSVVVSASSLILWLCVRRPSGIPPNPWFIFPIIGHRPLLRGDPISILRKLRSELGDVFSVYVDAQLIIVVNGFAAIKEAFMIRGEEFHWRPNTRVCDLFHFGVICNSGREWRDQRRVTVAGLQHCNGRINPLVKKEAEHLISAVKEKAEEPFDALVLLQSAVFNGISSVIFSRRLDYADARIEKAMERFAENLELFSDTKFPNFFPFQKFLMGDFFDVKFLRINMAEVFQKVIIPVFEEHKAEYNPEKIADFLDVYIREMEKNKEVKDTTIEEKSCQAVLYDFLWHGTTVTGATLQWALVFLLRHPDVKSRLQQELDLHYKNAMEETSSKGAGEGTKPETQELPTYFQAFIHEVQRCANVCQISMAHAVAKEKFLKGYKVPGDAVILPNLDSLMMDPDVWGDPEAFKPDRFINSDGKVSLPPEFIPFFIGVRGCPASNLAQSLLSIFLSSILFNFDLESATGQQPSPTRGKGLIPLPPSFKVKFIPRR